MITGYDFKIIGNYFYIISIDGLNEEINEIAIPLESVIAIYDNTKDIKNLKKKDGFIKNPIIEDFIEPNLKPEKTEKFSNSNLIVMSYSGIPLLEINKYLITDEEIYEVEIIIEKELADFGALLNWLFNNSNKKMKYE